MRNMVNTNNYTLENRVNPMIDGQLRQEANRLSDISKSNKNPVHLEIEHIPSTEHTIYFTKNYSIFKFLEENRKINDRNKKKIMKSMMVNGKLFSIVIINEKGEIIDGQHRVKSTIELEMNLPIQQRTGIYYVICKGYGIKEVQTYNDAVKRWDGLDFLHSYCKQGNENYIKFAEFMERYETDYWITLRMLNGNLHGKKTGVKSSKMNDDFRSGNFTFSLEHYINASNLMEKIGEIKKNNWFVGNIDRTFILAFDKISTIKNFDYTRFVNKLSNTKYQITEQGKRDLYLEQFGKIYNEGLPKNEQIKLPIKKSKNQTPLQTNTNKKTRINRKSKGNTP
jgi:hypothetical protein